MNKFKLILSISFYFALVSSLNGQFCFDSYTSENCPNRIVSEFAISTQLNLLRGLGQNPDFALNLGIQKRIEGDFSMGLHWFSNLVLAGDNSSFQMGLRPRFAYKLNQDFEASISPGVILTNSINGLGKFKGLSFETNISWKNKVGVVVRVDDHNFTSSENDTVVNLGIQTFGNTSLYTFGGTFLGGGLLAILLGGIGLI